MSAAHCRALAVALLQRGLPALQHQLRALMHQLDLAARALVQLGPPAAQWLVPLVRRALAQAAALARLLANSRVFTQLQAALLRGLTLAVASSAARPQPTGSGVAGVPVLAARRTLALGFTLPLVGQRLELAVSLRNSAHGSSSSSTVACPPPLPELPPAAASTGAPTPRRHSSPGKASARLGGSGSPQKGDLADMAALAEYSRMVDGGAGGGAGTASPDTIPARRAMPSIPAAQATAAAAAAHTDGGASAAPLPSPGSASFVPISAVAS